MAAPPQVCQTLLALSLMWDLENNTRFAADHTIVLDQRGERHWVVVLKGTFTIHPDGTCEVAEEQVPVQIAPEYTGADGESTLLYESELCAEKPRTDIYLNAVAHAPKGEPCTEMIVGLRTPAGQKSLRIIGDRKWERNLIGQVEATPPLPFTEMPIVYERAHGGWDQTSPEPKDQKMDPHNPVGVGVFAKAANRLGTALPNCEHVDSKAVGPAGFSAICGHWQPRLGHQGTYDGAWFEKQRPLLPVDYNPLALQCAPIDQQIEPHVRGDAMIETVNLSPTGSMRFALPKHYFGFRTHIGANAREHRAKIDTVIVEPHLGRLMMVWRTVVSCHHQIDDIDFTRIWEKKYV